MNKLVSKNPIQRFKLGNRIVKAANGLKTYRGQTVTLSPSGSGIFIGYDPSTKKYNTNIEVTAAELDTKVGKGNSKGKIYKGYDGYWYQNGRKLQSSKLYGSNPEIKQKQTVRKPTAVTKPIIVTKPAVVNKSSIVPKTSFYGQGIGGTVLARGSNFNGLISDDARNKLIATGKFDNNSFSSVQNFQTALNNYFANDGVGSITVDDKWGNQTQKAFDLALAKAGESHGQIFNPNVNQYNNTIETPLSTVSYGYTPTEKIQVTTPQRIYNRADVRDFIRSRGKNAYGFSGAQRRALRMVMNGQGTDTDRAIVSGMGIFKKGGLISRNPINRFKSNR